MYIDFIMNSIVVLFLCGVIILIDLSLQKKYAHYVLGIIFGLITILIMNDSIIIAEGRFFDFRHITMTMAGFIGGPVTAVIAATISSLYRYNVGGSGSMGGISSIIFFGCFGSILARFKRNSQNRKKVWFWFITGIVIEVFHLFIIAFIHPGNSDSATVLRIVSAPFLIITPLVTTIIFNFYYWAYGFFGKALILNTIINNSDMNLIIFDTNGPILRSKNLKTQSQISQYLVNSFLLLDTDKTWLNTTKQQHKELAMEDGSYYVADLSGFQMPSGESACVAIVSDVTDRKKEQEKIRRARNRFAKAFDLGPHMMIIIRKSDYSYVDVNRRFLEARGFAREDVIGKTPTEIGVPESELKPVLEMLETQGIVQNLESTIAMKYGNTGTFILSAESIQIDDQDCILLAYNDVTEMIRMQAEIVEQLNQRLKLDEELSRSNQLIADIITNMPDVFFALDNKWRFTYVNKRTEELALRTREDLLGKDFWEAIPQARGTILEINYLRVKKDCVPIAFESLSLLQKDTWYQINAYPFQSGLAVYYTDITEKKLMREKLIQSKKETISILESMTDCFFAIDENWQFTYVNTVAEIAFGKTRDELLGRNITEVFRVNDTALQNYYKAMSEKRSSTFEIISEALSNKWLEMSVYPSEIGLTCYFRDITSRKIAEKEIARLDRFKLVGQMAAGIGHEIRNPMTIVRGYLQLLGAKPHNEAQKPTFDLMILELDRANSIISEFLSLARTKQSEMQFQNLNDILNHLYPLLEADTFTQNKQIEYIPGNIPHLELNQKEIVQLVLNLARNGLEAMKERGRLTIKTYLEDNKVVLAIEDEGCGIPPEDLDKVGIPFYTTKENGTGLGLATSFKITEFYNAKIHIDSSPRGTKFFISFPTPDGSGGKI